MGIFSKMFNFVKEKIFRIKPAQEEDITHKEEVKRAEEKAEEEFIPVEPRQEEKAMDKIEKKPISLIPRKEETEKTEYEEENERIQRKLTIAKDVKELEEQIDDAIMNKVKITGEIMTLNDVRPLYEKIFSQKLKDQQIMDVLIENRRKFKHRITIHVKVYDTEGGIIGTIDMIDMLIEDTGDLQRMEGKRMGKTDAMAVIQETAKRVAEEHGGEATNPTDLRAYVKEGTTIGHIELDASFI